MAHQLEQKELVIHTYMNALLMLGIDAHFNWLVGKHDAVDHSVGSRFGCSEIEVPLKVQLDLFKSIACQSRRMKERRVVMSRED